MLVCANLFIGIVYVRVFAQIPVELKKKKKISRNNQVLVLSVHWGSRFLNRATPPGKTKPKKASNIQVNEVKMLSLSYVEGEI